MECHVNATARTNSLRDEQLSETALGGVLGTRRVNAHIHDAGYEVNGVEGCGERLLDGGDCTVIGEFQPSPLQLDADERREPRYQGDELSGGDLRNDVLFFEQHKLL